jgi:alkylhydroperoxidase/carboxymuconolactone decarboxylase family protein YurZ
MSTPSSTDLGQAAAGIVDSKVARLIAIGASMAANNESRFIESVESLRTDGAHDDEIRLAVQLGQTVKDKPAGIMKAAADRITGTSLMRETPAWRCPAEQMKQNSLYPVLMLIAAGSAMAANCEPCLNKAVPDLIEAGVHEGDIRRALEIGQTVKDQQAEVLKEAADILADTNLSERSVAGRLEAAECSDRRACTCA